MLIFKAVPTLQSYAMTFEQIDIAMSSFTALMAYPLFLAGYHHASSLLVSIFCILNAPLVPRWDMLLHHFAAFLVTFSCNPILGHPSTDAMVTALLKMELSTIFLNAHTALRWRLWSTPKWLEKAAMILFIGVFLQVRTWEFTAAVWQVRPLEIMNETGYTDPFGVPLGYLGVVLLCGLNLYWTALILKKVGRMTGILRRSQGIREIKSS